MPIDLASAAITLILGLAIGGLVGWLASRPGLSRLQNALEKDRALRQQSAREMKTQVEDVTLSATKPLGVGVAQQPRAAASARAANPAARGVRASTPRWSGQAIAGAVRTGGYQQTWRIRPMEKQLPMHASRRC